MNEWFFVFKVIINLKQEFCDITEKKIWQDHSVTIIINKLGSYPSNLNKNLINRDGTHGANLT